MTIRCLRSGAWTAQTVPDWPAADSVADAEKAWLEAVGLEVVAKIGPLHWPVAILYRAKTDASWPGAWGIEIGFSPDASEFVAAADFGECLSLWREVLAIGRDALACDGFDDFATQVEQAAFALRDIASSLERMEDK